MNELQRELERLVSAAAESQGTALTRDDVAAKLEAIVNTASSLYYDTLIEAAPAMLMERRRHQNKFDRRNRRRWQEAFDLIDAIWVSCEELASTFNRIHRPSAIAQNDYSFEALIYLHSKALLVTAEIICLLKGGFSDGALTRWRTLYELSVISALMRQNGQDLSLRYLAHSRVQAWEAVKSDDSAFESEERARLKSEADQALTAFGSDLLKRNGWACELTGQRRPTFDKLAEIAGMANGKWLYSYASHHIHSNHRPPDDLLGLSEAKEPMLLVGASNSGMSGPLTLTALSLVEITTHLMLSTPNVDIMALVKAVWMMADRLKSVANRVEA